MFSSPINTQLTTRKKSPNIKRIINATPTSVNNDKAHSYSMNKLESHQRQQFLKRMLRDHGLQQYLRVKKIIFFRNFMN